MSISIKRILFPTDFSEPSKESQLYAMALAEQFAAELHVLHVVPLVVAYPDASSPFSLPEDEMDLQIDAAKKHLAQVIDPSWSQDHRVKLTTVTGSAVDEILKYANDQQIDVIVVGTHGRSGLSRFLIGSIAEKLVRSASCPVLTVHPKGHQFVEDSAKHS